jgi:isopenicillin-N epimerase
MIPLNLAELGAAYYTGNCHKWICAPKGAGFLYVAREHQPGIRPLSISHGANSPRTDRSRFLIEFGWTGTFDASAILSVPRALEYMNNLAPGGWPEVMARNHRLALAARNCLCEALQILPPCPDGMLGSLVTVPLPDATVASVPSSPLYADPLQDQLRHEFGIEVPVIPWPSPPRRVLRISAQLYNALPEYRRLADALQILLGRSDAPSGKVPTT